MNLQKFLGLSLLVLVALPWGCVAIDDDKVQVQRPSPIDDNPHNVIDKCDPHIYPHRLIEGTTGVGSALYQQGSVLAGDQATFDNYWNSMSPSLDANKVPSFSMKPLVSFDQEEAYFLVMEGVQNSCQKAEPYGDGMITDCYNVTFQIYRYTETTNCQPVNDVPVFVYIFPKPSWPLITQWIDPTATPTPGLSPTAVPTDTPLPTPTATPVSAGI